MLGSFWQKYVPLSVGLHIYVASLDRIINIVEHLDTSVEDTIPTRLDQT